MTNKVTSLGKFLRRMRVDFEQPMKDMADKLGYSVSFLSAIELGKKSIPDPVSFVDKIAAEYHLSESQKAELEEVAAGACDTVPLIVNESTGQYAIGFARMARSAKNLEELKEMINDL